MLTDLFILTTALYMVIKGSTMATNYAGALAKSFNLSKYTVGFIIVAVISILPETFISIDAAIKGIPEFGLGTLFGSNIADLTLIFVILVFYAKRNLKVESKILKNHTSYPFFLLLPIILGIDGYFSRIEGVVLILSGALFYYFALRDETDGTVSILENKGKLKNLLMLILSMLILLLGAHFTVNSATYIAYSLGINPILVGMLIVGLGTTMPELFFSLNSIKKKDDSLAIGDILGTVLADATIVVGILALVNPFMFPKKIIYITGIFMVTASFILFRFMRSGKSLNKKEALFLLLFWILFVLTEFLIGVKFW